MGNFFKHLGSAAKNVEKKILNNPGRALEIAANIGTAAAIKNPKLIAATAPDIIKFVHQGRVYIWVKFIKYNNKCIQFIIGMTLKN